LADYELVSGIEIDRGLRRFIEQDVLPGTGIEADAFWAGLETILRELTPENKRLLARRDELQALIDARNESLDGRAPNPAEEEALLRSIFYLVDPPPHLPSAQRTSIRRSPRLRAAAGRPGQQRPLRP
jgi:malate synthase